MRTAALALGTFLVASVAISVAACADEDDDAAPGPKAGIRTIEPDAAPEATQRGRVIVARSEAPLEGATVTVGSRSATTATDGTYAILVPRRTPYATVVTAPDHYKLLEEEWSVDGDVVRGDTNLLSNQLAGLLAGLLPARDPAKGVLAVRVYGVRGCADEGGATLTISPQGAAEVRYFSGGIPSASATSVTKGESISAVFTNVDPSVPVAVHATSPACTELAHPLTEDGVTFTGVVRTEPGETLAYARVFLGPGSAPVDAGTDGAP
jgi:hypothetical protein